MTDQTKCDVCGSPNITLTTRDAVSKHFKSGWPVIWLCLDCKASVGCHVDTYTPLGLMASTQTRALRHRAHKAFDALFKCGFMSRERAKRWAVERLQFTGEFHISVLTDEQLEILIFYSKEYLKDKGAHTVAISRVKEQARKSRIKNRVEKLNSIHRERRKRNR